LTTPPYRYDPTRTAYSFAFGWVEPPPILDELEVDTFIREQIPKWIAWKTAAGELGALTELRDEITRVIAWARALRTTRTEKESIH